MKSPRVMRAATVALSLLLFSSLSLANSKLTACNSCTASQREFAVLAVTPDPGSAEVIVIDADVEAVYKYDATIDREPGLFVTSVFEVPVSQAEAAPFRELWRVIAASKELTVPSEVCGSVATYLYESTCQGRLSNFLRVGDGTIAASVNGLIAGGVATVQQALRAINANKPMTAMLRFTDGSILRIEIAFSVEVDTGAFSIASIKLIEAIGPDGVAYPLAPEGVAGQVIENASPRTIDDLTRLFRSWGVEIVRGCTPNQNRTRMRCDRLPPLGSPPGTLPRCTVTTGC